MALEREYSKHLVHYVDKNMEIIKQFLPDMEELLLIYGVKMDADSATLTQLEILMDRMSSTMIDPNQMRAVVNSMAIKVDRFNQAQCDDLIKSVLGMPMREIPFDRIIRQDAEADDTLREMWVQENLDYISNIDEQTKQKIKTMLTGKIVGNVNRRELSKELIAEIEKITQFERNRAVLIARDQVGKLNGRLMQYRQTHAGIAQYKWSSSHDQRVRPSHQEYDGKIYDWEGKNTAPEGSPGIPIRCRCVAIPVIDLDKIVTKPVPQSYVQVQEYRPVELAGEGEVYRRKNLDIPVHKIKSTVNEIYKSDSIVLKPREAHFIDTNITKTLDLLGVKNAKNLPKIVIVSEQEMQTEALACYIPATNTMLLREVLGDRKNLIKLQKDMACPDNPLSTFLHEFYHWQDAMKYIKKYGKLDEKYFSKLREFCRLRLVEVGRRLYNNISPYAEKALDKVPKQYDEVYTEYRVKQLLEEAR